MPQTSITYDGVPTDEDMLSVLLPETDEMYQFRNAFRVDNEAQNRDGDAVEYPGIDQDFDGALVEVEPGGDFPDSSLTYDGIRADWTKYGFTATLTDEEIQDSKVNVVLATQQEQAQERVRTLDSLAFNVLDGNRQSTTIGTDGNDLNYNAVVDAYTTLVDDGYEPSRFVLFLSPDAWGDIAKSTEFTQATETFAQELRGQGPALGEIMGIPAMLTNTGNLGADEAMMVDTGMYGWESPRKPFDVSRIRHEDQEKWTWKLSGRYDWVATDDQAALKIIGGA